MMNPHMPKMLFVVGAGRSGTDILATTLLKNLEDVAYLVEINDLWTSETPGLSHDMVTPYMLSETQRQSIRDAILRKAEGKTFVLDKTAANVLRLDLIHTLFPEAKVVHIIRDGRDVAVSTRKKLMGDIRKITRKEEEDRSLREKIIQIRREIEAKLKSGLGFKRLLLNFPRYAGGLLRMAGLKKGGIWGPRFPGIHLYAKMYDMLGLSAVQWKTSVFCAKNYAAAHPELAYREIHYEALMENPEAEIAKLLTFLEVPFERGAIRHSIDPGGKSWRGVMDGKEKREVASLIEDDLLRLGYPSTFAR